MNRIARLAAAGLFAASPALASAATYSIDSSHTHVGFKVRHMMVSWVNGEFGTVAGTVDYDPAKPEATVLDVTIGIDSVDTRDPKRDEHLRSPDFLDMVQFPEMTFKSKRVTRVGDGSMTVVGDLTIRGVTREVALDVSGLTAPIDDPWGYQRIGASATAVVDRQDFGITWNKGLDSGGYVVGDDVQIGIDVEIVRPGADQTAR